VKPQVQVLGFVTLGVTVTVHLGGARYSRSRRPPCRSLDVRTPPTLADQEWDLLEPLLSSPVRRRRPPKWPARRVADAVFYLLTASCNDVAPGKAEA
jgi:hypothetical protein